MAAKTKKRRGKEPTDAGKPPKGKRAAARVEANKVRRERFVLLYLQEPNATKAYRGAGWNPKTQRSAEVEASKILREPEVAAAIAAGNKKINDKLEVTAESVKRMFIENRAKAMDLADIGAANKAAELLGRTVPGLFINRHEHGGPGGGPIPVAASLVTPKDLESKFTPEQLRAGLKLAQVFHGPAADDDAVE